MDTAGSPEWQVATEELMRAVVEQAVVVRREYAKQLGMIAELVNRGAAVEFGYGTPERMLIDLLRVGRGEARRTVVRATALHDTVGVSGAVRPAVLPATAAAAAEGAVSVEHVDRIVAFHESLPADVDEDSRLVAESALADIARTSPPHGLTRPINELTTRLDPDGAEPSEQELRYPHRELRTLWHGDRFRFAGDVDRETGMLLEAVLSPLAAPRPAVDGDVDVRSVAERHGDAFATLIETAARTSDTVVGDSPVTILLTMDADNLRDRIGAATTMDGAASPARNCAGSPATPESSPHYSVKPAKSSTWEAEPAPHQPPSATGSSCATRAARSPAATDHPTRHRLTTYTTGQTGDRPQWTTWCSSAGTTTASSTTHPGKST